MSGVVGEVSSLIYSLLSRLGKVRAWKANSSKTRKCVSVKRPFWGLRFACRNCIKFCVKLNVPFLLISRHYSTNSAMGHTTTSMIPTKRLASN